MTYNVESTVGKWRRLTDLIVELTTSDDISWKEGIEEDEFIASVSNQVITISKQFERGAVVIKITLSSNQGKKLDEFSDELLGYDEDGESYATKLNNLLLQINRKVSGADKFLDQLLAELEKKAEIPF